MSRPKWIVLIAVFTVALCWAKTTPNSPGNNADQGKAWYGGRTAKQAAVTGTVVGVNCWLARGAQGSQYRDSAVKCALRGTPLAILTDDGDLVYPIVAAGKGTKPDIDRFLKYTGQEVRATGQLVSRGQERGIIVDRVDPLPSPERVRSFVTSETPDVRLVGRVVDIGCWLENGDDGTSDPKCVGDCAIAGDPLVVVADDGQVYYPVEKTMPRRPVGTMMLSDYCAKKVRVNGTVISRGKARAIVVQNAVPYASR